MNRAGAQVDQWHTAHPAWRFAHRYVRRGTAHHITVGQSFDDLAFVKSAIHLQVQARCLGSPPRALLVLRVREAKQRDAGCGHEFVEDER